ncbi:Long-chain-fatty-acid--CoA ligase [Minicystis rosea]|nr:Long-chain-fatty-acid--CoA ligase [Minicystis rosea]
MGLLDDRLSELRRLGLSARFRAETVLRVGFKLGVHKSVHFPGAKVVARDVLRGRANASTIFRLHAADNPDRPALVQAGLPDHREPLAREAKRLTYGEANAIADRLAMALVRRGVGRGSAVLIMVKNRIEFFLLSLAANRAGAAAVTVSWRSTVPELAYLAGHSGAEAVFFDADVEGTVREAVKSLAGIPRRNFISVGGAISGFPSLEEIVASEREQPEDVSHEAGLVMYTSGTTGKPKGAVRKLQKNALAAGLAFIDQTPMELGEMHLAVCPLYHATATGFSTMAFLLGGTVVVLGAFTPDTFLDAVERYRIQSTALVPTMIHRLIEHGSAAIQGHDLRSLRAIFSGGAPLGGQLAIDAMNVLGDKLYNFYGATETGMVTLASPADLRAAPGTIGRAVPGNEIRLVDDRGHDVRDGEVGELYARNGMMVEGYHADPDATRQSMLEGYFSVGDLARRDAAGRFHIEGRKRDMIISGGVNVYPAEVEAVIEAHPAVAEVAVVGVPDREWGERVRAFMVKRRGRDATEDELKAWCRDRLAGPKVPRDFVFLETLPKNPTGKILKRDLRNMVLG